MPFLTPHFSISLRFWEANRSQVGMDIGAKQKNQLNASRLGFVEFRFNFELNSGEDNMKPIKEI